MGVSLPRHKLIAFTISSFYAGIAGALLPTVTGFIEPGSFNLLLSVQFLAMILIGGGAPLSGSLPGGSGEHTPELPARQNLVFRLLLHKKETSAQAASELGM